ncbi:head GIN domain-containing protein [uncultured Massilia sp.]|uniref:head GIN domain-containing protein n=1 Tax=uncultured Massilia sp. TaxID=169973 RepID=UPI00258E8AE9|nr:head GIN domain-containing protein [uncultured Massilia sp.]
MNTLLKPAAFFTALALLAAPALADEVVRESRNVDARVTKVKLGGVVDLVVRQGATPSLVVSGDKRYVQRITTSQRGDTLEIDTESLNDRRGERHDKLRAELTVPKLSEFSSEGVGASQLTGFSGDSLRVALEGAGAVTLNGNYRSIDARLGGVGGLNLNGVRTERLDLNLGGAGRINVSGESKVLHATLAGVGSLDARELRAETVDLDMSGLGGATVHATQAADVDLSGMGSATVYGKPASRRANTSGMGKVAWK